jgi:hypothetical protein
MNEKDVIRLARKNGVSIYPVYVLGNEKWMMEMLARETGDSRERRRASYAENGSTSSRCGSKRIRRLSR